LKPFKLKKCVLIFWNALAFFNGSRLNLYFKYLTSYSLDFYFHINLIDSVVFFCTISCNRFYLVMNYYMCLCAILGLLKWFYPISWSILDKKKLDEILEGKLERFWLPTYLMKSKIKHQKSKKFQHFRKKETKWSRNYICIFHLDFQKFFSKFFE